VRTHEDALRSFKRYLALALADPRPRLAAAKVFLDPATFDPNHTYAHGGPDDFAGARHVWFDLDPLGVVDAAALEAADTTVLVPMGFWAGYSFWGNPPGLRFDGTQLVAVALDATSVSPDLVQGCASVSAGDFATVLSADRWATEPALLSPETSREYRLAMLTASPAAILGHGFTAAVAHDALADPLEWDIRFSHDLGEIVYPAVIVKPVGAAQLTGHALYTDVTQAFVIYAYPRKPNEESVDGSVVQVKAERVRQLLTTALAQTVNRNGAHPMRIPLFDYDGVPADQPSGRREEHDYLRVVDASVDVMPEPTDTRMAVVIADVRLNWRVSLADGRGARRVAALNLDFSPS
jgi:hypothetical protein